VTNAPLQLNVGDKFHRFRGTSPQERVDFRRVLEDIQCDIHHRKYLG